MFDTINSLAAAFAGRYKAHGEARKLVWILLFTFLAGWLATAYAGWVSYPSYRGVIEFLPGADYIALFFTAGIAGFLYFGLAYLAGYAVERWRGTAPAARNYATLGARIFIFACALFLAVDVYMNLIGTTYRAQDAAGDYVAFTYETPSGRAAQIEADRAKLDDLQAGKLGGYGWRAKDGIYHLNSSGKKLQRALSAQISAAQAADSEERSAAKQDWQALNSQRANDAQRIEGTLKNAVYGVYLLVLMLCVVQAYIVETMQEATGASWRRGERLNDAAPGRAAATARATTPPPTLDLPLNDNRSNGKRSNGNGGYEITCEHCGTVATKRSAKAKYCSDDCRTAAWEQRTGAKLKKKPKA